MLEVAQTIRASLVITLGGLLADTPHSRPVPVTGTAELDVAQELGLSQSRYEGPTGIVGVLHDSLRSAGVSSASLWAAVPHYVSIAPNPKAALALVGRLATMVGTRFDTSELTQAAVAYEREVGRAVEADAEVASYVHELESGPTSSARRSRTSRRARRCGRVRAVPGRAGRGGRRLVGGQA